MKTLFLIVTLFALHVEAGQTLTWQQLFGSLASSQCVDFSLLVQADELPVDPVQLQLLSRFLTDTNSLCVTNGTTIVTVRKCEFAFLAFQRITGVVLDLCHDVPVREILSAPHPDGGLFREHFVILSPSDMRLAKVLAQTWLDGFNKAVEKPALE